jgi:hypothetical protein
MYELGSSGWPDIVVVVVGIRSILASTVNIADFLNMNAWSLAGLAGSSPNYPNKF